MIGEDTVEKIEASIIGSVLLDPERCLPLAVREGVAADWFTEERRGLVWDAIMALWAARKGVDPVAVLVVGRRIAAKPKSRYEGTELSGLEIQGYLDQTPTTAHFEYYLNLGRGATMTRRIKKAGARWSKDLSEGVPPEEAARAYAMELTRILSATAASKTINLGSVLERIREEYKAAHQKRMVEHDLDYTPGVPLPWHDPNVASQGVQEGLYYLGARPSVGKTAFMLNLIRYWCELKSEKFPAGVKVAFNSLDMAIKPMLKRPLAELSRVSLTKASFGTTRKDELAAIDEAIDGTATRPGVKSWPLTLLQERDVDVFRSWCLAAKAAGALDIVVVDFVQLMGTKHRYSNDNEKLASISGVLKSIAIDLDIPVIALSQLNRACEEDGGRVPTASDLRGSGALEQDATAVWILHSDRDVIKGWDALPGSKPLGLTPAKTDAEFRGIGPVRFIIAKNQNGQAGPDIWFPFVFYKKYCLFMLGDVEAKPIETETGVGATKKVVKDYSPLYAMVSHDWRSDPFEKILLQNGVLTGYDMKRDTHLL